MDVDNPMICHYAYGLNILESHFYNQIQIKYFNQVEGNIILNAAVAHDLI